MNNSGRATNGDAGKAASFDVGGLSEGLNSLFNPKKDRKEDGERDLSINEKSVCSCNISLRCRVDEPGDRNRRLKASGVCCCQGTKVPGTILR